MPTLTTAERVTYVMGGFPFIMFTWNTKPSTIYLGMSCFRFATPVSGLKSVLKKPYEYIIPNQTIYFAKQLQEKKTELVKTFILLCYN